MQPALAQRLPLRVQALFIEESAVAGVIPTPRFFCAEQRHPQTEHGRASW